jgi:quercetin dioxygenase-like cupin family protein
VKAIHKISVAALALAAFFMILAASPVASKSAAKDRVVPAGEMQFKEGLPGISKAVLWGDPTKGPYGGITRFNKGTKVDWHTHPHDIKAVVISGTLLYDNGSGEKRLGPGSFVQERSGIKHTTAASSDSDLVFFEEGSGPFGVKMVK